MTDIALLENLLLFGRVLRGAGLDVHHGRMLDAARALAWIDVGRRGDVRKTMDHFYARLAKRISP